MSIYLLGSKILDKNNFICGIVHHCSCFLMKLSADFGNFIPKFMFLYIHTKGGVCDCFLLVLDDSSCHHSG